MTLLLGIVDYLRRGFARFKLCADLLDLRRLLVETRRKLRDRCAEVFLELPDRRLLFLRFAMRFQKLIQQHRVHRVVAHSFGLPLCIACHQLGISLSHILCN